MSTKTFVVDNVKGVEKTVVYNTDHNLVPVDTDAKKVGEKVYWLLDKILTSKETYGLPDKWKRNYEMVKGEHWRKRVGSKVPLVTGNIIYTHLQRTVNLLTDNNPTFNVVQIGQDTTENEFYDKIQRTVDHWWIDQEQQQVLDSSVKMGEINGIAIEKVIFNPRLEYGLGEIEAIPVDPFYFGFYPTNLKNINDLQKSEAILHFYPMGVREARRIYNNENIKAEEEILKELGDDRQDFKSTNYAPKTMFVSILGKIASVLQSRKSEELEDQCLIVECWCKDYTLQKITRTIAVDGEVVEKEIDDKPKYQGFIRCITVTNGGKIVLADRSNPSISPQLEDREAQKCYLYDKYPFTGVNSVLDVVNAWGESDIEQLERLNMEFDKALSQIIMIKDQTSRLKIINPKTSGVANDQLTNAPGFLNPSNATEGAGIRYLEPPQLPIDVQQALDKIKDIFFLVAGTFDLDQARETGREVIAYKAIAALLEQASTMMKGKIRNYSRLIRDRGRMFISHVFNWYSEDRWITYVDPQGTKRAEQINGWKMRVPVKLTVVTGSTMPISKVQQREEAIALFGQHAIDQVDLLQRLDWPGRKDTIDRMQQGVFGALFKKLEAIGMPPQMMQVFQGLASMDDKQFAQQAEKGFLPNFDQLLQQYVIERQTGQAQPDPVQAAEVAQKQAETEKEKAMTGKAKAETLLIIEKSVTERVQQGVAQAGVEFDAERIEMERKKIEAELGIKTADLVARDLQNRRKAQHDDHQHVLDTKQQKIDAYKAEAKASADHGKEGVSSSAPAAPDTSVEDAALDNMVKSADQRSSTGEKGIVSDNQNL